MGMILLFAVGIASLLGCGDGRPKRVPVSGQVLIDGKPLTVGFIRLIPDDARPASGRIGPDGRFTLKTFESDDGVVLGTHPVTVRANKMINSTTVQWLAPKEYSREETSELTATIDGPDDSLVIKLTWDGGKPFVEFIDAEGGGAP